jgi:hypothetical protein
MANANAKATQKTSEEDLNKVNMTLRAQPWYQQFFKERGLDPNKVKLSGAQRQTLTGLAAQNGYALGDRMKFDEAGNMNQKGGYGGMPTWAKVAIAAAPIAGSMLVPGVREAVLSNVGSIFGAGGTAGGGGGAAAAVPTIAGHAVTTGMATAAPTIAGTSAIAGSAIPAAVTAGGSATASAPSLMSRIAAHPREILSGAGRMISQAGQASATNRGVEIDARLAHDQLNLQAQRETRAAEGDAFRKSLYGQIAAGYQPSQRPDGIPSRAPSDGYTTPQAKEAGQLMTDTAMARMRGGDYGTSITPFSELPVRPRLMERISNYAGPAMSLFDPRLYGNGRPTNG